MASLKSLTDDDLRKKLKQYGITSPVTASTRNILIKKLNHVIANQKKSSTPNSTVNKTRVESSNRLHTFSSDEDEDKNDSSIHYQSSRTSRLSRSKRDSVRGSAPETPMSDRNGATNLIGNCRPSLRREKSYSSNLNGRDRVGGGGGRRLNNEDNNTNNSDDDAVLSLVNSSSYSEVPSAKRTRCSVGTYFPVCARSGISPRAKIYDDYDTGSDSDLAESVDAVDLSSKAAAAATTASAMCNNKENSVLSNNNSFTARAFYQNHKSGISTPSDRLLKGDSARSRKGRQIYMENGRRHEDECSEDHDNSFGVAESVVSQTAPGGHEPIRVANGRHHSETNSPIEPSQGDESTWHYSIPLLLLVLLAVFFGVVAMLYVNMRIPLLPMLQSVPAMIYQAMAKLPVPFLARTDPERQSQTGDPAVPALPPPYLSQSPQPIEDPPSSSHTSENRFPICNSEVKEDCLTRREMAAFRPIIGKLDDVLMPALRHQAGLFQCGNAPVSYLSVVDMQALLQNDSQTISSAGPSDSLIALGKLVELNNQWGLKAVRGDSEELLGISLASPPTYVLCHITAAIYSFIYLLMALITAILTGWLTFYYVSYYKQKKELEKQQVFEMVEQILEVLGGLVGPGGKDYVAINHVRDSLIGPRDRKTKKDIWKKAVAFIDNYESRIRCEVQSVGGEDCTIWRWASGVPHSPNNSPGLDGSSGRPPAKMWQGQAFESLETTHNLPNVSPTSCLKIRNMFDCDVEFGDSWPSRIQDSILEKCEGISIVHVAVDRGSREGCVYLKCASLTEAGRAFRALHGWWYDGNLVTVKFLRDERYHQRFPSACHATRRLRPSNNKRLSLQAPAGQPDSVEHP